MTETAQQYYLPAPDGAATAQPQAPPVYLNPAAHTELGQLLGRLAAAKAAVTEAEAARDAIIADIKAMGVRYARQVNGGTIPGHIRFPGTPRGTWTGSCSGGSAPGSSRPTTRTCTSGTGMRRAAGCSARAGENARPG